MTMSEADPREADGGVARIVKAAFARPLVVVVAIGAAAAMGAFAFADLRRDVFPDLSVPVFGVIVQNAAMSAEELEIGVAIPLESALAGAPEVARVRSTSQLGVVNVTVEFDPDADYARARQLVTERMTEAAVAFPDGTTAPILASGTGRLNEIFELILESDDPHADLMALRDLAEFDVKDRLLAVPGVAAVERLGGELRQFVVEMDADRMATQGIALDDVVHAVSGSNQSASGGFVVRGPTEWSLRAVGRAQSAADIASTVVAVRNGTPVLLSDVAEAREAPALRRGVATRQGREIVYCRVIKQFGADTVTVSRGVRAALDSLSAGLPKGVHLRVVYDQAELIGHALGGVGRAVLLGSAFVVLVILLLLGDVRAALIVTLTLPLSIAVAGLVMRRLGIGLNTMTLGGLAISVGILVDSSIIMTENIVHRLAGAQAGSPAERARVARSAAVEVGRPIVFATAIIVAVFLPLYSMSGLEARMYGPLATSVIASVLVALALALTLTPLLCARLLRPHRVANAAAPRETSTGSGPQGDDVRVIRWAKRGYAALLDRCAARPGVVTALAGLIAAPLLGLTLLVGSDFMPKIDEGALFLNTVVPGDASLAEVVAMNQRVDHALRSDPDVADAIFWIGRAEKTEDAMPHTLADVLVPLKEERAHSLAEVEVELRERLEGVVGVSVHVTRPLAERIDEGLGGTPADIAVHVFGPDLAVLAELGERAAAVMARVDGLEDIRAERMSELPQVKVTVARSAVARAGLTPGDVVRAVRVAFVGEEADEVWVGQRRYDLLVRLADPSRNDPDALGRLLIDAPGGARIPLAQLASIDEGTAPGTVRREAGSRRVGVEAAVSGRDLASAAQATRDALRRELELPQGYFLDVGGRVESQARAARALGAAALLSLVLVILLVYIALDSLLETFVIVATLPTAVAGGVVALLVAGETWNVSSLVGVIGLMGIAVQNGLVLFTQTRHLTDAGAPFAQALREASLSRVRPKLMTAGTAILGLAPLLLLRLPGTEIERPLAVVMVGGLVTSTAFTLLVLPTAALFVASVAKGARSAR